ncbi:hypothetical protein JCGZ_08124 [Jatropha curcas]|uniref:Uncharacterized protein n=1 Tax=Jatropha curcas TaxID=180498 RepID=A0A067KPB2_JATCU|nr:uncharacterized protein LOC105635403 [Jatropha curcas]KDP36833.1 hypothetical protein JCGZ_08124 [Jatropha curcas]
MAAIIGAGKATCHVRSISLPARSHPLTLSAEVQIDRLRSSQATQSSACDKLNGLKNLYESIDDLLQLPLTQQTLANEKNRKSVDEVLDGSLRLLDVCGSTIDIFSQMKEYLKEVESSLRRRKGGETGLLNEVEAYISSRKIINKVISKCFRNLKSSKNNSSSTLLDKDSNAVAVIGTLRKVEQISVSVCESLLSMLSQPKTKSRPSGWSIVSKLLQSDRALCKGQVGSNEVKMIDAELLAVKSIKNVNLEQVQIILKGLEALESSIQEAEKELECVYRKLLNTRVTILNMINQ